MATETIISATKITSKAPLKRSTVIWIVASVLGLFSIGVLISQQSKKQVEDQPAPAPQKAAQVVGSAVQIDEELAGVAQVRRMAEGGAKGVQEAQAPVDAQVSASRDAAAKSPSGTSSNSISNSSNGAPGSKGPLPVIPPSPLPKADSSATPGSSRGYGDRSWGQSDPQAADTPSSLEVRARGVASKAILIDEPAKQGNSASQDGKSVRQQQLAELARVQSALAAGSTSAGLGSTASSQVTPSSGVGGLASNDPYLKAAMSSLQGGAKAPADANKIWLEELAQTKSADAIRPTHIVGARTLTQGKVIPAILIRNLNSDLPGEVVATSSVDIYDSLSGRCKLIPKGSSIVGRYSSGIAMGQERLMFAFTRLILPNGLSFNLPAAQGMDVGGQSGVQGDVNNHFFKMFAASFLVAYLAEKAESATSRPVSSGLAAGSSGAQTAAGQVLVDTSRAVLQRYQNISPTITIDAGTRINVQVVRDMEFPATQCSGATE